MTRLVGDIGGTNARFALLDGHGAPAAPTTLRVADFPDPVAAIRHFLTTASTEESTGEPVALHSVALALATPIVGDVVKLTNSHWVFSTHEIRAALGLERLQLVNDFTALALSVPDLPADQLDTVGGGSAVAGQAMAVIGPGTGLGVSGLVPCGEGFTALNGEGGHVTLGGSTPRERALHVELAARFTHVSAERYLSGPGLVNIADALCRLDGQPAATRLPADVTRLGLAGEHAQCREALDVFCSLLGKVAGNLVLTLGAQGGCYIGGGVVPRLGEFFHRSRFREAFEAKGRMSSYLAAVPTYVIHAPYPALVGAARALGEQTDRV